MRGELAAVGVDAAILPNGIAERWLRPLPPGEPGSLRAAFGERPAFVKVARFDQDKRWLWAIDAIAIARSAGLHPRLLMRGSRSPYPEAVAPRELLTAYQTLRTRPELAVAIRSDGRATAKRFVWSRILDGYEAAWETAFALSAAAG